MKTGSSNWKVVDVFAVVVMALGFSSCGGGGSGSGGNGGGGGGGSGGGGGTSSSNNAYLSSLALSAGALQPAFNKDTLLYSAEVALAVGTANLLTVTPTSESDKATIKVNGQSVQSGVSSPSISLEAGGSSIEVVVTAEDTTTTRTYQVSARRWVEIARDDFEMGSPKDPAEFGRYDDELQHPVNLRQRVMMLSTEVTQDQFEKLMQYNPSKFNRPVYEACPRCPVEQVSWHEAAAYCNALSEAAGMPPCYTCTPDPGDPSDPTKVSCTPSTEFETPYRCPGYRLPTEAEWEYAARAGTTGATYAGELDVLDDSPSTVLGPIAWYRGNSGDSGGKENPRTHEVGKKSPNPFSLYDMLGNVDEWCHDWYADYSGSSSDNPWGSPTGYYRVFRGGSWGDVARDVRAARRNYDNPITRDGGRGLRPVKTQP